MTEAGFYTAFSDFFGLITRLLNITIIEWGDIKVSLFSVFAFITSAWFVRLVLHTLLGQWGFDKK